MKKDNLIWVFLSLGGFFGGTAVLLSAWGAHGLESSFMETPTDRFSFNFATDLQLLHSLLLVSVALFLNLGKCRSNLLLASCIFLILGILLFSLPIYTRIIWNYSELSKLTPFGGVCFFLGWSLISAFSILNIFCSKVLIKPES